MSVPQHYKEIGDFHEYYSGKRTAPYLTIFVGGNHEASNHLFELYYGGWVAPNIYYLGAANVLRYGPLRIAGMSGIWKGYDYRKPHFERLPYNDDDIRSIFHVRELDVRKLLQIRTQVDLGLSHDWPKQVEYSGDYEKLFKIKKDFRHDSEHGMLGNTAARYVLDRLRPPYWFSAHLHVKFMASIQHGHYDVSVDQAKQPTAQSSIPQPPKVPYMFGMDGAALTSSINSLMEDQPQGHETNQPLSTHTANEATTTAGGASNPIPDEKPSEPLDQETPKNNEPAVPSTQYPDQNEGVPPEQGHDDTHDTHDRLSAWKNFHTVAATQEAAENSRFLMDQNQQNTSEVEHNLTWRRVDIDDDGARRRTGLEEPGSAKKPESKKQKTRHDSGVVKNADEIDLDLDSDSDQDTSAQGTSGVGTKESAPAPEHNHESKEGGVSEDLRSQLPASFARPGPSSQPAQKSMINGPLPEAISNKTTQFLALDKCEPHRHFLQLMELHPVSEQDATQSQRPYRLQYDKESLAISRVFADDLQLGNPDAINSVDKGDEAYKPRIIEAEKWIEENVVKPGKLDVPQNFTITAPIYDPAVPVSTQQQPPEYTNPQTAQFCELIGIENKFHLSDEEREARAKAGPRPPGPKSNRHPRRGIGRGGRGGRKGGNRRNY